MIERGSQDRKAGILVALALAVVTIGCRDHEPAGMMRPGRPGAVSADDYEEMAARYEEMLSEMPLTAATERHRIGQMAAQMRHFASMMHGGGAMGEGMPMGRHSGMGEMRPGAMGAGGARGMAAWHLSMAELLRRWATGQRAAGNASLADRLEQMASRNQGLAKALHGAAPEPETTTATKDGATLYSMNCSGCHGPDGRGVSGAFPPLAGSPWLLGPVDRATGIVLRGLQGPLEVGGETYYGLMPSFATSLDDEELAALLTFARSSWGNQATAVDAHLIATVRAGNAGRGSLTAEELGTSGS